MTASFYLCERFCLYFVDVEPPDVLFNPQGYLLLSSKDEVELMENDHKTQLYVIFMSHTHLLI